MTKRVIKKHEFDFLKQELQFLEKAEVLAPGQIKRNTRFI